MSECICVSADMSPYCSEHDEWLIMKLYKLYLLKLAMAVDNIVFRIIKGAF